MEINLTIQEVEKIAEVTENPFIAMQFSKALYELLEARENEDLSRVHFEELDFTITIIQLDGPYNLQPGLEPGFLLVLAPI